MKRLFLLLLLVAMNVRAATIRGTVRDARNNAPVSGFDVAAYDRDGRGVARATTNSDGHYSLAVPAGVFVVATADFFNAFGYRGQLWHGIDCGTTRCPFGSGAAITLNADDVRDGIDFALTRIIANVVSGRAVDSETGELLSGAKITMVDERTGAVFTATSGTDGRFSLADVPRGRYTLRGIAPHYTLTYLGGLLNVGDGDTEVELRLVHLTTVKVIAIDAITGAPVDDLREVHSYFGSAPVSGNTAIVADVPPVKTHIVAVARKHGTTSGDSVPCPTNDWTDCTTRLFNIHGREMTFIIRMQPYLPAHGRVFDADTGAGIAGATVNVSGDQTTTAADGTWSLIPSYEPRSGYIDVTADGYVVGSFGAAAGSGDRGTVVTLTPGVDLHDLSIPLVRGGTISGTVTDETTGEPIAGATVSVNATADLFTRTAATTDVNGRFVTPSVIGAHPYRVSASAPGYATNDQPVTGQIKRDISVNLVLRKTGAVVVQMVCSDGAIQRPYGVSFYDRAGRYVPASTTEPLTVVAGDYYVSALASCGGGFYPNVPYVYQADVTRIAKPVSVRAGETTLVQIIVTDAYPGTRFEPRAAPASGGTVVTFNTKWQSTTRVFFGEAEATVLAPQDELLRVAVPAHATGVVDVTLGDRAYAEVQHRAFTYTNDCTGIALNRRFVITGSADAPATFTADIVAGSSPFQYQWFRGPFPSIAEPQATTPSFVTEEPLRLIPRYASYWVRVSNPCSVATMSFDVRGVKVRAVR